MDSGSSMRHVIFRHRGCKVHQSISRSSSSCSSLCVDNVSYQPHFPVELPHGSAERPRSSGDRSHSSVDRPLSVGRNSDSTRLQYSNSVKLHRPRRSAFESAVRNREAQRHRRPDKYGPVMESESASSSSPKGCDYRRHGYRQYFQESHQRRSLPTRDYASSDVCRRQSHVQSLVDGRSFQNDDQEFGVTDVKPEQDCQKQGTTLCFTCLETGTPRRYHASGNRLGNIWQLLWLL